MNVYSVCRNMYMHYCGVMCGEWRGVCGGVCCAVGYMYTCTCVYWNGRLLLVVVAPLYVEDIINHK